MKEPKTILSRMTLGEKASICDGADFWRLKGMEKYGFPSITVCDGPHGLRKKDYSKTASSLTSAVPAICFPPAVTSACSWDPDLLFEMGAALGRKCLKENVGVLLGPGANMKRSPLCGRNFEYFSEDPLLAGELAAAFINGVQSKGVGTSLKHFAVNNQETRRMTCDSVVDERALREIYLTAFEIAVKKGKPWTVMNSYNKINGSYASENGKTQIDILRGEWGFDGAVVSDWGAVNDRILGLKNGNDLQMPSSFGLSAKKIVRAINDGSLDEAVLDKRAANVLALIKKAADSSVRNYQYDESQDWPLARKIACRSMVLLKNDGVLPLKKSGKTAVIGQFAAVPRYQGAGSSVIRPEKIENALDELKKVGYDVAYARGYERFSENPRKNASLRRSAAELAKKSDAAIVFVGLPESFESEGYDRTHMRLPRAQDELVEAVARVNKNVVVVLACGSPVEIPWADDVNALLNSYLGGQAGGGAVADIISGRVNPSGKLAETFPLYYADTPAKNFFPGNRASVEYRESVYIGYRYYEKAKKPTRYPFGFGLSYTTFEYSDLKLDKTSMDESETLKVTFKIRNTGETAGFETAQLYVADKESSVFRPVKELKAFKKIWLNPGQIKPITLELSRRAFAFYNAAVGDWSVESGDFDILIGASSADVRLSATVTVSAPPVETPDYSETAPVYYTGNVQNVPDDQFAAVLGGPPPPTEKDPSGPLDITDNFENASRTKWGGRIYGILNGLVPAGLARTLAVQTPFRDFVSMSGGVFSEKMADGLLKLLNGEKRAARLILKEIPTALKGVIPLLKNI